MQVAARSCTELHPVRPRGPRRPLSVGSIRDDCPPAEGVADAEYIRPSGRGVRISGIWLNPGRFCDSQLRWQFLYLLADPYQSKVPSMASSSGSRAMPYECQRMTCTWRRCARETAGPSNGSGSRSGDGSRRTPNRKPGFPSIGQSFASPHAWPRTEMTLLTATGVDSRSRADGGIGDV